MNAPSETPVTEFNDPETCALLTEIETLRGLARSPSWTLRQFLRQAFFDEGWTDRKRKFTRDDLNSLDPTQESILDRKIGKLGDNLYKFCAEIARSQRMGHIERHDGKKLYTFLNSALGVPLRKRQSRQVR